MARLHDYCVFYDLLPPVLWRRNQIIQTPIAATPAIPMNTNVQNACEPAVAGSEVTVTCVEIAAVFPSDWCAVAVISYVPEEVYT